MITDIDGPTEAEIRARAALGVAVLALDVIRGGWPDPRECAELVLGHLREHYNVTPENT